MPNFTYLADRLEAPLSTADAVAETEGALELLELGSARRQELFGNRLGLSFPNIFGYFFGFVGETMTKLTGALSTIIKIPLDLISSGVGEVITAFAGIVGEIPIIGEIAAAVLLAVNAIVQAVLDLPEEILKWAGNLGMAFKTLSPQQQASFTSAAIALLVDAAPPEHKAAVEQKLAAAPPPGSLAPVDETPYGEIAVAAANVLAIGAFLIL